LLRNGKQRAGFAKRKNEPNLSSAPLGVDAQTNERTQTGSYAAASAACLRNEKEQRRTPTSLAQLDFMG
jgi:hypothetical protein